MLENFPHNNFCRFLTGKSLYTWKKICHLCETNNHYKINIITFGRWEIRYEIYRNGFPRINWIGQWLLQTIWSMSRNFLFITYITSKNIIYGKLKNLRPPIVSGNQLQYLHNSEMSWPWLIMVVVQDFESRRFIGNVILQLFLKSNPLCQLKFSKSIRENLDRKQEERYGMI